MVTPYKSFILPTGFQTLSRYFLYAPKKKTPKKKFFKRLYTQASFNTNKTVSNSLVKRVVSVKLMKN